MQTTEKKVNKSRDSKIFYVKDCSLITLSLGIQAQTLRELKQGLSVIPEGSIYHHFWGHFLQKQFKDPEHNNDFAAWASSALHDKVLKERFNAVNPRDFSTAEEVRKCLIDLVEERLDESETFLYAREEQMFFFQTSRVVVFDTGLAIEKPEQLVDLLPTMSDGSIFYHYIDSKRKNENARDDFDDWLLSFGDTYLPLRKELKKIDPCYSNLQEIRNPLIATFKEYFSKNG